MIISIFADEESEAREVIWLTMEGKKSRNGGLRALRARWESQISSKTSGIDDLKRNLKLLRM